MATRIVDIHPHVISTDTVRYPIAPLGGHRSTWSRERPVTFEELVAAMDDAGVDKAAIVHSSTTYGYDNSYLADAIANHHDRFTGVFSVDVLLPDAPVRIRHWLERGLSGLRLFAAGSTVSGDPGWINDTRSYPAWSTACELDIPVAISMRIVGLPHLRAVIARFPDVRIVLDHLLLAPIDDGPPYAQAQPLFELADLRQVYLKLTTNNIRRSREGNATQASFFRQLVDAFGANRIAYGSNYPAAAGTLREIVREAKVGLASLTPTEQHDIFCVTAMKLYPSLADRA